MAELYLYIRFMPAAEFYMVEALCKRILTLKKQITSIENMTDKDKQFSFKIDFDVVGSCLNCD